MAHRPSKSFINILYNLAKWPFLYSVYFSSLLFFIFFPLSNFFFCFSPLFLFVSFFFLLSYMYFFSLSKVTRMIGVPLVAKQGSFVYIFWLCSSFSFSSVHTQLFTIELFTMDLITCELIYIPIC